MLEVKDLHVYYGAIHALQGINLKVGKKQIVAVLGANGAGKSTLLRAITGLVNVHRGEILFEGRILNRVPPFQRVSRGIAMVPEGRGIFPQLTVKENLLMGAYPFHKEGTRGLTQSIMEGVFRDFPVLEERAKQRGGTLSGGEQQMLSIARALMSRPRLLLLDEPSMGLSPLFVKETFRLIPRLRDQGTTLLLVEQNARAALKVAERGYVLEMGSIAFEDAAEGLAASEVIQTAYLA